MRALAVLLLVPGFTLGLVAGLTNVVGTPRAVSSQSTDLVWSDRVFTSRADFAAWLSSRGSDYKVWSERHPAAARHFEQPSGGALALHSQEQQQAAGGSVTPRAGSTRALLIASISLALLVAMLTLARLVRPARFLLESPGLGRHRHSQGSSAAVPLLGPSRPQRASALGSAPAPGKPRSVALRGEVALHWREGRSRLGGLGRIIVDLVAAARNPGSHFRRRYLPTVAFYGAALFFSFAIGASVAIYLK
jgi:hypothetical protein